MTDTRTTPNDYKPLDLPPEARAAIKKALEPNGTSTTQKTYKKTLDLSPEALAALKLPLRMEHHAEVTGADGSFVCKVFIYGEPRWVDYEIATFIANALNDLLTPAAPAALCEYDDCDQAALPGGEFCTVHQAEHDELMADAEQPVPMCADPECLNAADPTTSGGARCLQHEAERWTAEQILQREG